jgi:hypothetical protein
MITFCQVNISVSALQKKTFTKPKGMLDFKIYLVVGEILLGEIS